MKTYLLWVLALMCLPTVVFAEEFSVTLLGGDHNTAVTAINATGHMVGNTFTAGTTKAFFWNPKANEVVEVPAPEGEGLRNVTLHGISADGIAVGEVASSSYPKPVLWTKEGGTQLLPELPAPAPWSRCQAISADGNIVVGCSGEHQQPCIWTRQGNGWMVKELPQGPSYDDTHSTVLGISPSGLIAVGWTPTQSTHGSGHGRKPCVWFLGVDQTVFKVLKSRDGGEAFAVNDAGVIVGTDHERSDACVWTDIDSEAVEVDLPNAFGPKLTGINNHGMAVGTATVSFETTKIGILVDTSKRTVRYLSERELSAPTCINDQGEIGGSHTRNDGTCTQGSVTVLK